MNRTAVLAAILALAACGKPPVPPQAGPPEVSTIRIVPEDIPAEFSYVGRTTPNNTVQLRARVTGILMDRPYQEGQLVKKGDVLFQIDQREFQAAVDSTKARVAQAEAQVAKTTADLKRTEPLTKAGAASQSDLDAAVAAALAAKAERDGAKADQVRAELDLSFSTITAPFDGMAGKSSVDPGALVSPSSDTLAVLDEVDPIAVDFTISEAELLGLRADITSGRLKAPTVDKLPMRAQLVDGSVLPQEGHIAFRDVRIKPETGTALIRARFPNPEGRLRAGQFIRLTLTGATRVGALLVPQTAVLQSPTGANVYVVDKDGKAEVRNVVLGIWVQDRWMIASGLQAGDQVIVDGIQRVRAGSPVKASPWKPADSPETKPADGAKPADSMPADAPAKH
jgi:membrane fusion protein, multidrug efflux system